MTSKILTGIALSVVAAVALAAAPLKSGPSVGDKLSAFEPTHVAGPDKGTNTCPVCKYGAIPAVQVWVNGDSSANVIKLAGQLESAIKTQGSKNLKAFIVFVNTGGVSDEEFAKSVTEIADKSKSPDVAFTYVSKSDPSVSRYKINLDADVKNTVLFYKDRAVKTNGVNLKSIKDGLKTIVTTNTSMGGY
jgi:protocatechuate 3,4-dioxygenase beta subunit